MNNVAPVAAAIRQQYGPAHAFRVDVSKADECRGLIRFALESFDAVGGWRSIDERGNPVDNAGAWANGAQIDGFAGLRSLLLSQGDQFVRFFQHLSSCMGPRDFLLLGADCVKETDILERAYNDSRGITAEFILNVFLNLNRRAQSNFDLERMRYQSRYNRDWRQVEMFAATERTQEIRFPRHDCSFVWSSDDPILVEISRKFEPEKLRQQLRRFDLEPVGSFFDSRKWFALLLLKKSRTSDS